MINIPHNKNYALFSKASSSKDNQNCKQFVTLIMIFIHKLLKYIKA